jgi:hypothetical protein
MSNENISEDSSLCDRQPFDYVSCEGLRETRSCYHTQRSATAHWTNAPAPNMSQTTPLCLFHPAENLGGRRSY